MTMPKRRRKKHTKVVTNVGVVDISATSDGGMVFHTETTAHCFTWRTPKVNASAVILPTMPCNGCGGHGMIFVGAFCTECGSEFRSAFCLASFSEVNENTLTLEGDALKCEDCRESVELSPPPERITHEGARWN